MEREKKERRYIFIVGVFGREMCFHLEKISYCGRDGFLGEYGELRMGRTRRERFWEVCEKGLLVCESAGVYCV